MFELVKFKVDITENKQGKNGNDILWFPLFISVRDLSQQQISDALDLIIDKLGARFTSRLKWASKQMYIEKIDNFINKSKATFGPIQYPLIKLYFIEGLLHLDVIKTTIDEGGTRCGYEQFMTMARAIENLPLSIDDAIKPEPIDTATLRYRTGAMLSNFGWTHLTDCTAIAIKEIDTVVGKRDAHIYLIDFGENFVLQGDFTSKGENVLSSALAVIKPSATDEEIREVITAFNDDVSNRIASAWSVALLKAS